MLFVVQLYPAVILELVLSGVKKLKKKVLCDSSSQVSNSFSCFLILSRNAVSDFEYLVCMFVFFVRWIKFNVLICNG